nr:DAK2 domain-containing protein [Allofustis seminis]
MIVAGQKNLEKNHEYVNELNVFPVPDGDTGTNMNLTFTSGKDAVLECETDHVGEIGRILAKGLLMGARGNSGVILSQLFRGFSKKIEKYESLDAKKFATAFQGGVDAAYKAIMKPVEGTILTVAREAAKAGEQAALENADIIGVMAAVKDAAQTALDHTPEQLPVLKEVGFVDSGGQGLVFIYEGFLSILTGEAPKAVLPLKKAEIFEEVVEHEVHHEVAHPADIVYGYCTEIMVRLGEGETVDSTFDYDEFRNYLNELGDSLLVVADDEIVKVHVHTEKPGEVMNYGQKFGSLIKIKVDNMREQNAALVNKENQIAKAPEKDLAIITVAAGEGVSEMFRSMGVDYVLKGGQTMNPSTHDFVEAMEKVPAKNYLLLPNNSNIFLAAKQAAEIHEGNAAVVETRTIQQGLTAMLAFHPDGGLEENLKSMAEEMTMVTSGQITFAVRDTEINGLHIKKDHYIGLIDGEIKVTDAELNKIVLQTITEMIDEDSEMITLIFGEDVSEQEAELLQAEIEEAFDDLDVEIYEGNQPVYPYLISVE